ncbi:MAG: hypothetical protein Q9187_003792 [Circinaria calcarea]
MVGKRDRSFHSQRQSGRDNVDKDLENGLHQKPRIARFKDAVDLATESKKRSDLKKRLKEGIDRDGLEKFRKSEKELKDIKDKKVRHFYEEQNGRLNDWLEVDTLVMSMADDILDSMNPDRDHDGIIGEHRNIFASRRLRHLTRVVQIKTPPCAELGKVLDTYCLKRNEINGAELSALLDGLS